MGKTVSTLTALADLHGEINMEHALVIAPLRVANSTWPDEINAWEHTRHLDYSVCTGSLSNRLAALSRRSTITLINRENVYWLVSHLKRNWFFDTVVIDESSSFKSHSAQRFKALKYVRHRYNRVIELTGTPVSNGLLDLWSQMFLLDQGERLGKTFTGFRDNRFIAKGDAFAKRYFPATGTEQWVYDQLADICLTMRAEDYLDLPETVPVYHDIQLSPNAKRQYDQLERDYLLDVPDGEITAFNAAVLSNKLLQLASGAAYLDEGGYSVIHEEKLDALEDIISEAAGTPLLVAYNYKSDLKRLQERFPTARALDKDPDTIDRWNAGRIPLLLAHPASAGHGLNLQRGSNICVWFTLPWSLELYQQFNKRLDRQGQTKAVIIHHLVSKGTVDEAVVRALAGKAKTQNDLLDSLKDHYHQ